MNAPELYPMTFTPVLKDYLWGGRRLETLYGRALPPGPIAESWEISGHPSGPTLADSGKWLGQPLPAIQAALGHRLTGTRGAWALERERFPLLIKLLDAHQDLSLQVHPGDAYALASEGDLGKNEMWYILHAEPGTRLILGLEQGTTREAFEEGLASGELRQLMRYVPIRAGQAIDVPAGTVHALLAGTVVTEIQQSSDATYRISDWGRVGSDGRPRPLHVTKALAVMAFGDVPAGIVTPSILSDLDGVRSSELVRNPYFVVEEIVMQPGATYLGWCEGDTMEIWGCVSGQASVRWSGAPVGLPAIRYVLLPAELGAYQIAAEEYSTCLRIYLP